MIVDTAVDEALTNMPEDFVIKPFLMANRAEVKIMFLTEYTEKETIEGFHEDGYEAGIIDGERKGRRQGQRQGQKAG